MLVESSSDSSLTEKFLLEDNCRILSLKAVSDLQKYLTEQKDWIHNFGLTDQEGKVIGKMFGVLVVINSMNEIGYISAFSGKLAVGNHHSNFVPPVFDGLSEESFVNAGMMHLKEINKELERLENDKVQDHASEIQFLKAERKDHSILLQNEIFEQYHFLNKYGVEKSLIEIFQKAGYKNPPSGAGECAAPKLLQYAFQNSLQPLVLTEFWWGLSPKSDTWKHKQFYRPCKEKCEPILEHMLEGLNDFVIL